MRFFSSKPQHYFSAEEHQRIVGAILEAEKLTSGEIRIFIESRCRFVDPLDRAKEVFYGLKMDKTERRNGVLVYIAMKDHQLAVYGDEGIHHKVGSDFWKEEVGKMLSAFRARNPVEGITELVKSIGTALQAHFPYMPGLDKNEMPDDIVFGK
ncbi:MAG: TPM domain-containing protein [Chitinophagaceae bacterium]|nr:TPM domain-containing protein [Chitinophagaceae bacterium]